MGSKAKAGKRKGANVVKKGINISGNTFFVFLLTLIRWLTYLSLVTPLIVVSDFFFPFVGPKSLFFMGVTQVMSGAYVLLAINEPRFRPKLNALTISLIIYLVVLTLTTLTGVNPSQSFWSNHERMTGLLMWLHLVSYFLIVSSVFKSFDEWRKIFITTLGAAVLVSSIALATRTGLIDFPGAWAGSTIGNSSFMGVYLLFNAFIGIHLFMKSNRFLRYYSVASLILILSALYASDANASKLAFVGGLALLFILCLIIKSSKIYLKIIGISLLIMSLAASLTAAVMLFQPDNIIRQQWINMATEARLTTWSRAVSGIAERFWLGWGPENYNVPFIRHFDPRLFLPQHGTEVWFDRAHNILLDTLISSGIVGLLSYLAVFVCALLILWRLFKNNSRDFLTPAVFSVALVAYFVQNLTVFDMINSYLMFMLILAYSVSVYKAEDVSSYNFTIRKISPIVSVFAAAAVLAVFINFTVMPYLSGSYVAKSARSESFAQLLNYSGRAINSSPLGRSEIIMHLAETFKAFAASEEGLQADSQEMARIFSFYETELLKSTQNNPQNYRLHINLAALYNTWAHFDASKAQRAINVLDDALNISPTKQTAYWSKAQAYLHLGRYNDAINAAQAALELEPGLFASHIVLVQVASASGDKDLAEKLIAQAVAINPDWETELTERMNSILMQ